MLVEYHGADPAVLQDAERIRALLVEAAEAAGATVVQVVLHRFSPQGVSGVVLVTQKGRASASHVTPPAPALALPAAE